jgi:hypothetical protein
MKASPAWLFGSLLAGVVLSGCGSGDSKSSGGAVSQNVDACKIVTQQDAAALFGQMASSEPPDMTGGRILGQCHWTWDTTNENQLLQFYVWDRPEGYSTPSDSEPFAIGEKGNVRVVPGGGQGLIDVMWVQTTRTVALSYSPIGSSYVPIAQAKVDAVKALAQAASGKLAAK